MSDGWHVRIGYKTLGPLTENELRGVLKAGRITHETLVRRGNDGPWIPASQALADATSQKARALNKNKIAISNRNRCLSRRRGPRGGTVGRPGNCSSPTSTPDRSSASGRWNQIKRRCPFDDSHNAPAISHCQATIVVEGEQQPAHCLR